jgi:putative addiction module antidote
MNEVKRDVEAASTVLQIRRIGNSVGLILPKELLARLKLKEGDKLHAVELPERGFKLSPYDETHAKGMEIARRAFRTYANTFRELAK